MKAKTRDIVSVVIFLFLLFAAAFFVRPAYKNLLSGISGFTHSLLSQAEEFTSLKISYKSLSPSILSAFYVKDIKLTDSNGETVVKIDKLKLEYRLFQLIKGNLNDGFASLLVDGVEVDIDAAIPIVKNFISDDSKKEFDFSSFKAALPLDFTVKNVSLSYKTRAFSADANLKKITIGYSQRKKQLDVALGAAVAVAVKKKSYNCDIGLSGSLFDGFENSSAVLSLSNLSDGVFKLNTLNLLLGFKDGVFSGSTVRNSFPLRFNAQYDMNLQNVDLNFVAEDFSIESIFASNMNNSVVQNFKDLKLTSDTFLYYDVSEKKLSYSTDSLVKIPDSILPGGVTANVSASGDEKQVDIDKLSLKGNDFDVSAEVNVSYKTFGVYGLVDVPLLVLPNGISVSTELFLEPLKNGSIAYIPEISIGEKSFSGLELSVIPDKDSIDFSFVGYDYSHFEAGEPGRILAEGSYLRSSNYIQTAISANSVYIDSVVDAAAMFLKPKTRESAYAVSQKTADYMFSGDAYFSTDFSSVSFNVPYIVLANTKEDNQFLMLSLDGNEQSISVSQADLILGKRAFHAAASVDRMSAANDLFFSLNLNTDSMIPYNFSGTLTKNLIRVSGDYDAEIEVDFGGKDGLFGYVQFSNFPIPVLQTSIVSSLDVAFSYSEDEGPVVKLRRFALSEAGNKFPLQPRIAFSGAGTKYGVQLDSVTYTDLYSTLEGNADIVADVLDGVFNYGVLNLNLKNTFSDERLSLEMNVSNPEQLPFSIDSLLKGFYVDAAANINRFSLNRFTKLNASNNEITAAVSMTGTIEHPYVSVGVEKASVMVSGTALTATASFFMEDRDISITALNVRYKEFDVNNVSGFFSLDSFSGEVGANIDGIFLSQDFHIPLRLQVSDAMKESSSFFPSSFTVFASADGINGPLIKKDVSFSLSALFSKTMVSIISSENIGLVGYYNKNGAFSFRLDSEDIAKFSLDGTLAKKDRGLDGKLYDVSIDLAKVLSYINFQNLLEVFSGTLSGTVSLRGTLTNPEFFGVASVAKPDITLPTLLPDHVFADDLSAVLYRNEITVQEKKLNVGKNDEAVASCNLYLDKWKFEHLDAWVKTEANKKIRVNMKNNFMSLSGNANINLALYYAEKELDVKGSVYAEKGEVFTNIGMIASSPENSSRSSVFIHCDINVLLGSHIRMTIDPLLRCIFVPNGILEVQYDQRAGQVVLDGTLGLKSGDVSYLNRNFYIKDGTVKFSESDEALNPRITVSAETRTRDANGDNVTVILNAENQPLSSFMPRFSSVPAKSENEIRTLLGQIAVADSEKMTDFLFSAGDYALQTMVGRKIENSLRDFLNFDILSLRLNIVQNALNFGMNNNALANLNPGNFLDNSTVYIGRYFGSAFYVDAMVHLQYDDKRITGSDKWFNGLVVQPEFGFEISSPFTSMAWNNNVLWSFNFRLNVAPDIGAMIQSQQFVPATTLSLSWKFTF